MLSIESSGSARKPKHAAAVEVNVFLAYLISVGIAGAGAAWIAFGGTSLCVGIGAASIVVGLISLRGEYQRSSA